MGDAAIPTFGDAEAIVAAFEQGPIMCGVLEGPEHRLLAVSGGMRAAVGGKNVIGLPYLEAFPEVAAQGFLEMFDRAYAGETFSSFEWRIQIDLPDGGTNELFATLNAGPWRADDGTVRGVIVYAMDVTERALAQRRAEQEAAAARRQAREARQVLASMQDLLLPSSLPVLPQVELAGHYVLAEQDTAAGGDWLDVATLSDGRVALVVGDVVGHGATAAAVMSQARSILLHQLETGAGIVGALQSLDALARRVPGARSATVAVVELDPGTGDLTYCTAGHPPPLVIGWDGAEESARYLEPTGSGPVASGRGYTTRMDRLERGGLVLLYSDGIVERPEVPWERSTVQLLSTASAAMRGSAFRDRRVTEADAVCAQVIEILLRAGGQADDVTLLAARRTSAVQDVCETWPATMPTSRLARDRLDTWLDPFGMEPTELAALQVAVGEAVANAIEHAYDEDHHHPAPHDLDLAARLTTDGVVEISVTDHGRWREPRSTPSDRGRGLGLMQRLTDEVQVDRGPSGTTVTLRQAVVRPVQAGLVTPVTPPPPRRHALSATSDGASLHLSGALDIAGVGTFRAVAGEHVAGHPAPVIDLTALTVLSSAGVQALHDLVRRHPATTLLADSGTVAQHVLTLVGLPHDPADRHAR